MVMETLGKLARPLTFEQAGEYLWQAKAGVSGKTTGSLVRFIAYDPCPAFVIMQNGTGRVRCPRDEVFMKPAWLVS